MPKRHGKIQAPVPHQQISKGGAVLESAHFQREHIMISRLGRILCVVIAVSTASPVFAQDFSSIQKEVWQMEETYWKDVKDANYEHYVTLWHDQFLGWPRDRNLPVGKDGLADGARKKMA